MIAAATVFLSPSWPRRWLRRPAWSLAEPLPSASAPRLALAAFACFALLQVGLPLRHLMYDGNVLWHEQGMRWSWNVLVREKNGALSYDVILPDGRRHVVSPRRYLSDVQEREMSSQPDLILQLAHHIADDYRARGHGEVAVHAEARVSLNGRPGVQLIDRRVDLARIEDGIAPAGWILPEPESAPPRLSSLRDARQARGR
jgi:hypothetical protein